MKTFKTKTSWWRVFGCVALGLGLISSSEALEILRWERLPLTVSLVVGEERVVFVDRNVRVGVPDTVNDRLRVQSAGGAIYLRANAPIEPSRLQLQDAETGALILVDITAVPAAAGAAPLEPVRIVDTTRAGKSGGHDADSPAAGSTQSIPATPVAVVLTRYAAQGLYAPLRTVAPVRGIMSVPLRGNITIDTLLPGLAIRAKALAAWRLDDHWVTAVRLTHTAEGWLALDPRSLQGDFVAATFQHPTLGPAGESTDTTVVYLVTRGHGLAEALLPAISRIDASINMPPLSTLDGDQHEE
jgi:integrating conjugative element protein (TIGR03749 family)